MNVDDGADPLAGLRNEVLRRIGRNLLLFQQIELLMKFLLVNARLETGPDGPTAENRARQKDIKKKTLGQVLDPFFQDLFAASPEFAVDDQVTEIRFRSSFRISPVDADQLNLYQAKFEAMT